MLRGSIRSIKKRKKSLVQDEQGNKPLLTMQFSTMLKKMKQKKRE